jgi:tetratricopeptide (TPR) repeat protein
LEIQLIPLHLRKATVRRDLVTVVGSLATLIAIVGVFAETAGQLRALISFRREPIVASIMRSTSGFLCTVLVMAAAQFCMGAGEDLNGLQRQLATVEKAKPNDEATIAEICRRIVEADPRDHAAWEKRVRALLALGDLQRCQEALDAWDQPERAAPVVFINLSGDLAEANEQHDKALQCWTRYVKLAPKETATYEKIAWTFEQESRWAEAEKTLTQLIAVKDSAGARVWRARCRMEMRRWDDAVADINKANKLDGSDKDLKTWLPQFETLQEYLPKIKELDKKIAGGNPPFLILDRGLLFNAAQRYELALEDAEAAASGAPTSKRATLQKAQALIALNCADEAGKLHVIVGNAKFTDAALQKTGMLDAKLAGKPGDVALLVERARQCSDMEQYGLALEDATAAVQLDPKSADAMVEKGFARMKMDDAGGATKDFMRATELDAKNAVAWRSLGEIAMDRADYPVAIENFTRSLKLHESPLVLKEREQCYRCSGHNKEADLDYERAQKLSGGGVRSTPAPTPLRK